ncbi:hypothetical protein JP0551_00040 [Helicobacter pylori]
MSSVQILSNLNYPIGKVINEGLRNSLDTHIAVAFLKYSGVEVIQDALINSLEKGAEFEIIVGLDFKTTDSKSIRFLLDLNKTYKKLRFYCYGDKENNKTDIVFHPKIYMFDNGKEKTSIIGSTNLTKGGLENNFEVNTIFTEKKPLYYSQLNAIYNSIKYADSLFTPNEEYLQNYDEVFSAIIKNEQKVSKDKSIQEKIKKIEKQEKLLPGTIPSIKAMIVEFIFACEKKGVKQVELQDIYQALEERIKKEEWGYKYKNDTLKNSIRGELNHHQKDSHSKQSLGLFERLQKGVYALTPKGRSYKELKEKFDSNEYIFSDEELERIIEISPQNHKEMGFEHGWESRFDTWYKLMCEFGFCYYAKYEKILISDSAKMLILAYYDKENDAFKESVDESVVGAISLNALSKYEVGNPYKKNLNHNNPLKLLLSLLKRLCQSNPPICQRNPYFTLLERR